MLLQNRAEQSSFAQSVEDSSGPLEKKKINNVLHLRFRNWENNVDIYQVQRRRKCTQLNKTRTFLITGKFRERT